jgi:glycosyltransferase involved in cell wall biosynthesis
MLLNSIIMKLKNKKKIKKGGLWTKKKFKFGNKSKPLVSIITVTYNSEKHLQESLQSVFQQKYKNYELIIIDGKSNDKTLKIIKKNEKKIDYWQSEKDKGIYNAFNKGIKLARGDLIGMVNSDDSLTPNALRILVKYYNRYPDKDFFFGSVKKHWGILHGYNKWKIFYTWDFYSSHSTGFFIKKKAAKIVGQYDLKYKNHSDWDYMYRMIVHCKLKGISTKKKEVFGIFRSGGFSSKAKYIDHIFETIKIRKNNGQSKILVYFITLIKYFYNRHRLKNKNILYNITKKVFFN